MREGKLSERELTVVKGRARGLTNGQVAHDLGITEATVKNHVYAVCRALGVQSLTAVLYELWLRDLWGE